MSGKLKLTLLSLLAAAMPLTKAGAQDNETQDKKKLYITDFRVLPLNFGSMSSFAISDRLANRTFAFNPEASISLGYCFSDNPFISKLSTRLGINGGINFNKKTREPYNHNSYGVDETDTFFGILIGQDYNLQWASFGVAGKTGYLHTSLKTLNIQDNNQGKRDGMYFSIGAAADIHPFRTDTSEYGGIAPTIHIEGGVNSSTINGQISPYFLIGFGIKLL